MKDVSVIITSWKEVKTISKAVTSIITQLQHEKKSSEIVLISPDEETANKASEIVKKTGFKDFKWIQDPCKGKPFALNMGMDYVSGKILILTDGDVFFDSDAISNLLKPFNNPNIGGVTGRPVCMNSMDNFWGYWGHIVMDIAHDKRTKTLNLGKFFFMSGYILAMRNFNLRIPKGAIDDVYFSTQIYKMGYKIAYAEDAKVFVKQPSNLRDWILQKTRTVSGQFDDKYDFGENPRSFKDELLYIFFPLKYVHNLRQLFFVLCMYPLRLYLWARVFVIVYIKRKTSFDVWKRVESTK